MTPRTWMIAIALAGVGCGGKKKEDPPTTGSSTPPPTGSGTGAGTAAEPTGPGSQLTAPPDVPLTGEALGKRYLECSGHVNAGKLADYKSACLHADVVEHDSDRAYTGADSVVGYFEGLRKAMPDLKIEPQLVIVSGRSVVAVELLTGKHTGPLAGPDGKDIKGSDKQVGILTFEHVRTDDTNKITELWEYSDHHSMLDQLGVAPKEMGPGRPLADKGWPGAPNLLIAKDDEKEKANIALVDKATAAFNAHKAADMTALMTDDVVESDQASDKDAKGKAEIEKGVGVLFTAFPDAKATPTATFASGDYVVVEGRLTGTHTGPLGKLPATKRHIDDAYAEVFKIKDGKIAQVWRFRDQMNAMSQLTGPEPKKDEPAKKTDEPVKKDEPKKP